MLCLAALSILLLLKMAQSELDRVTSVTQGDLHIHLSSIYDPSVRQ